MSTWSSTTISNWCFTRFSLTSYQGSKNWGRFSHFAKRLMIFKLIIYKITMVSNLLIANPRAANIQALIRLVLSLIWWEFKRIVGTKESVMTATSWPSSRTVMKMLLIEPMIILLIRNLRGKTWVEERPNRYMIQAKKILIGCRHHNSKMQVQHLHLNNRNNSKNQLMPLTLFVQELRTQRKLLCSRASARK